MNFFTLDLHVASLPMRLTAIGFIRDHMDGNPSLFQHRHNQYELHYIFEGHCITRIREKLCMQQQNQIYLIAPGVYHSQKSCSSPFEKICIIFELISPPETGNESAAIVYRALSGLQYFFCGADRMAGTINYIRNALIDYENRFCGTDELRIVMELLLLQLMQQIYKSPDKTVSHTSLMEIQRGYLIDEFFNNNFSCNGGDALLAKKLSISIRQLNRILHNLYGQNFREKMLEIRLEIALDLLASNRNIAEISEITGYSCPANFSAFIKNATGKTPSDLRLLWGGRMDHHAEYPIDAKNS